MTRPNSRLILQYLLRVTLWCVPMTMLAQNGGFVEVSVLSFHREPVNTTFTERPTGFGFFRGIGGGYRLDDQWLLTLGYRRIRAVREEYLGTREFETARRGNEITAGARLQTLTTRRFYLGYEVGMFYTGMLQTVEEQPTNTGAADQFVQEIDVRFIGFYGSLYGNLQLLDRLTLHAATRLRYGYSRTELANSGLSSTGIVFQVSAQKFAVDPIQTVGLRYSF